MRRLDPRDQQDHMRAQRTTNILMAAIATAVFGAGMLIVAASGAAKPSLDSTLIPFGIAFIVVSAGLWIVFARRHPRS